MGEGDERRMAVRVEAGGPDHGIQCRILPGRDARLVDVSPVGVLVETPWPLAPGGTVCLQVPARAAAYRYVHGRVIRCAVETLCAKRGLVFRAAIFVVGSHGALRELCANFGQQQD
jgi:hypothetical protein